MMTQEQYNSASRAQEPIPWQEPIRYRIINGTAYHVETPFEVVEVLEAARYSGGCLRLDYGFTRDKGHDSGPVRAEMDLIQWIVF